VTPTKPQLAVLRQALARPLIGQTPTPTEARIMLRRVLDLIGGERRYRQLIGRLRGLGDESLADQLDWFIAEYKKRSTRPTGKARSRPKQHEKDDILLLLAAENRAQPTRIVCPKCQAAWFEGPRPRDPSRPSEVKLVSHCPVCGFVSKGQTTFEILRETVADAIATGIPVKPRGASPEAIVRRLYGLLKPRKPADSLLPFDFPNLMKRITPYRRIDKSAS
jgi:hypothetical protein